MLCLGAACSVPAHTATGLQPSSQAGRAAFGFLVKMELLLCHLVEVEQLCGSWAGNLRCTCAVGRQRGWRQGSSLVVPADLRVSDEQAEQLLAEVVQLLRPQQESERGRLTELMPDDGYAPASISGEPCSS